MTVEAIKDAIAELPEEERSALATWIVEQDYDDWDRQMVKDFSPGGRGYHLTKKVRKGILDAPKCIHRKN